MAIAEAVKFAIALFVITNPVGAIPIFLGLSDPSTIAEKKQIAVKAGIAILVIFTVVIFIGKGLLGFFGISVEAFRVAGGIIIFMLGISMLNSKQSPLKHTKEEHKHAAEKEDIAIVPLSIPIIAGPGAISSLIVASHAQNDLYGKLVLVGIAAIVALIIFTFLYLAGPIGKFLGVSGIKITTRVMGMILTALAVEMIVNSLLVLLPGLGS